MSSSPGTWPEANQRYLVAALALLRESLERYAAQPDPDPEVPAAAPGPSPDARRRLAEAEAALPAPSALQGLCDTFGLSAFERDVLLLCAGIELDAAFPGLCAAAQGDAGRPFPTFSLALAALPEPHWSALAPEGPLRRFQLVHLEPGQALTRCRLRIDERVLHHLTGLDGLDERLHGLLAMVPAAPAALPPSHRAITRRLAELWECPPPRERRPALMLCGGDPGSRAAVAAAACGELGLRLYALRAADLPTPAAERWALCRLWEREALLGASALLLECDESDDRDSARAAAALLDQLGGLVILSTREPLPAGRRLTLRIDLERPPPREQEALWRDALGPLAGGLGDQLPQVISQFNLGPRGIQAVGAALRSRAGEGTGEPEGRALWEACRVQARPRLEDLAQRLQPMATWEDLVLPEPQRGMLRALGAHVRQRARVHEGWGFARKGTRGLGITALFAGQSGTGKTMAAEVLANELRLDLYRIDLSQVVSKYIGETEKNLRRIFEAAEEGGALLLFDEADALFGKRSEVKDSHDRYANIEVGYLLQRMEAYRGLALLTSNMRGTLDPAFLRRLRFIIEFPLPGVEERAEIWRRIFPAETPTEGLDVERLARLNATGGMIRGIALNAAFLAADRGEPVRMAHLRQAARTEFLKLERPLPEAELDGWR